MRLPVHIVEASGLERASAPVRTGLPVPRGALFNASDARIEDAAGRAAPCQCRVLARWPDGSVKWILVDTVVDVEAGGNTTLYLVAAVGIPPVVATGALTVSELPDRIELVNGRFRYVMSCGHPALFSSVTLDGKELLKPGSACIKVIDTAGVVRPATLRRLRVEESGPLRVSVVCEGNFETKGEHCPLEFQVRTVVFAMSGVMLLECRVRNPRAAVHGGGCWDLGDPGSYEFEDLSLDLAPASAPLCVGWTDGKLGDRIEPVPEALTLYQDSSGGTNWDSPNHVDKNGDLTVSFQGFQVLQTDGGTENLVSQGLRATPCLQLNSPDFWIAATVRHFWQNAPKALRWRSTGLSLGLFPGECRRPFELQGGEQKRHTVLLEFGERSREPAIPQFQWPVHVSLDPITVAACGAVKYFVAREPMVDELTDRYVQSMVDGPHSVESKREIIDEYGWRNFGDLYADHEAVGHLGPEPLVSHYNNQYDFVYGAAIQFLRSGDDRWRSLMEEAAAHCVDIDIYHTDQDKAAFNGGLFWHTDHYKQALTATHRTYSAGNADVSDYGGGPSNEHNYTSGLLQYHYLTGDTEAGAAVLQLAQWVLDMDDGARTLLGLVDDGPTGHASQTVSADFHKPGRGAGNSINALLDAFSLSGERRFLRKAEELIQRCIHPADDVPGLQLDQPEYRWSYLVFLQVLGKYLGLKIELGECDYSFHYARGSLQHYAVWMAEYERPYKEWLDRVLIPTETWPAQDIRKAHVLHLAASYGFPGTRIRFRERARFFHRSCLDDLLGFDTAYLTRPQVLLCVYGHVDAYFSTHEVEYAAAASSAHDFGKPCAFVPQRSRWRSTLKRRLRVAIDELARAWRRKRLGRLGKHR